MGDKKEKLHLNGMRDTDLERWVEAILQPDYQLPEDPDDWDGAAFEHLMHEMDYPEEQAE